MDPITIGLLTAGLVGSSLGFAVGVSLFSKPKIQAKVAAVVIGLASIFGLATSVATVTGKTVAPAQPAKPAAVQVQPSAPVPAAVRI